MNNFTQFPEKRTAREFFKEKKMQMYRFVIFSLPFTNSCFAVKKYLNLYNKVFIKFIKIHSHFKEDVFIKSLAQILYFFKSKL